MIDICVPSQQLKLVSAIHHLHQENTRLKMLNRELMINGNVNHSSLHSTSSQLEEYIGKRKYTFFSANLTLQRDTTMAIPPSVKRRKVKESRTFKCEIENCDKEFTKQSKLKRHHLTHQKNRQKFICDRDDCKKSYLTKYDLVAHQVLHLFTTYSQKRKHDKLPSFFKCPFTKCDSLLESKEDFHRHKRVHLQSSDLSFSDLVFSLSGTFQQTHSDIAELIRSHGAQFSATVTYKVFLGRNLTKTGYSFSEYSSRC